MTRLSGFVILLLAVFSHRFSLLHSLKIFVPKYDEYKKNAGRIR